MCKRSILEHSPQDGITGVKQRHDQCRICRLERLVEANDLGHCSDGYEEQGDDGNRMCEL